MSALFHVVMQILILIFFSSKFISSSRACSEKEPRLVTVNVHSLKMNCDRDVDLSVSPRSVHDITTLSWSSVSGAIYLCAATTDNVVLMRCDYGAETLTVKKVRQIFALYSR